jgi:hypothetical protein
MKNKLKALAFVSAAILCGTTLILAAEKTGADYPNEKCDRKEKDGSITVGQCKNVCKDVEVGTKDVDTGHRTCDAPPERTSTNWIGLALPTTANSSVLFYRYNSIGEVQACAATSNSNELECRDVTIRVVNEKSGR